MMEDTLRRYKEHDIMTEIKTMKHMLRGIEKDIKTIVDYVQNILLQQKALKLPFNPLDVSEEYFITGPRAWLKCREELTNPELFGIFKWWGYDYLRCNLILDVNSLLKIPMQPWDMWEGYKSMVIEKWSEKDYEVMDNLSRLALEVNNNYDALYEYVQTNGKIKVPEDLGKVIIV